ncbi:similar to Saccharomyces cerevisiae YER034W Putative protein of unknown function [Maudiozyma saulgeensis]|uniref:Uncharacterized protein n=1 Tax=Maudiozyma saulgeensis TaxID=1789683 RepID=A0A1X7RB87_9SACH|nr:similar to Saccharomyces cerevisiae YER034W Putative protein of unknown function [Kazachstania saulgeensis]
MDSYSLKKDNRKKFQDKQKLKHKHATPSDKKYYGLKKDEETKEKARVAAEEKEKKLGNNLKRYDEDSDINEQLDTYDSTADRHKLQAILQERAKIAANDNDDNISNTITKKTLGEYTSKDIHTMDVDELNRMLGRENESGNVLHNDHSKNSKSKVNDPVKPISENNTEPIEKKKSETFVPLNLQEDQDFLDDIL